MFNYLKRHHLKLHLKTSTVIGFGILSLSTFLGLLAAASSLPLLRRHSRCRSLRHPSRRRPSHDRLPLPPYLYPSRGIKKEFAATKKKIANRHDQEHRVYVLVLKSFVCIGGIQVYY